MIFYSLDQIIRSLMARMDGEFFKHALESIKALIASMYTQVSWKSQFKQFSSSFWMQYIHWTNLKIRMGKQRCPTQVLNGREAFQGFYVLVVTYNSVVCLFLFFLKQQCIFNDYHYQKKRGYPSVFKPLGQHQKVQVQPKMSYLGTFLLVLCKAVQRVWQQVCLTYMNAFKTAGIGPENFETLFQRF